MDWLKYLFGLDKKTELPKVFESPRCTCDKEFTRFWYVNHVYCPRHEYMSIANYKSVKEYKNWQKGKYARRPENKCECTERFRELKNGYYWDCPRHGVVFGQNYYLHWNSYYKREALIRRERSKRKKQRCPHCNKNIEVILRHPDEKGNRIDEV